MAKKARVAINGFGRIGRLFFRQAFSAEGGSASGGEPSLEIVAVNDLGDVENLAYLLKYDSVYRKYEKEIKVDKASPALVVDGTRVQVLQEKDPSKLPWKDLQIDIAIEATGFFESFEKAKMHLTSGAKRVILTAPADDPDGTEGGKTVLMGVNDGELKSTVLTSNASCTTNAASPVIQIMSEDPGIKKAILSTVHAYTATQSVVDGPARLSRDFRRGRDAAENIVPSTTGAAKAIARAIPSLAEKFDGIAFRVPVEAGSIADITFVAKRKTTAREINDIFKKAARDPRWEGILKVTEEQLVSSDIIGELYGAIVDLNFTKVIDGDLVKVLSWYDNEAGYVATLVKHVLAVAALL